MALIEAVCKSEVPDLHLSDIRIRQLACMFDEQIDALPDLSRLLIISATGFCLAWSSLLSAKRFSNQSLSSRCRHLQRWKRSRLAPMRDLARFYCVLCAYFAEELMERSEGRTDA